jgi:polyhydroxybutyrate depolymerase
MARGFLSLLVALLVPLAGCSSTGAEGSEAPSAEAAAAASGCGKAPATPAGQATTATITSGGRDRTYRLHLPASYQQNRPTPVVLVFHGRHGTARDIEKFSAFDTVDAITIYPQGLPASDGETAWEGAPGMAGVNDLRFVTDLLDRTRETLCADPTRVFATGKSQGAGFVSLLACRMSDQIAAFGTVSGAFYPGFDKGCPGPRPVSLVDFHGTGDPQIHYTGGMSHRESYPPMPEWFARRAGYAHCGPNPGTSGIGSDVTVLTWAGCAPGAALVHYRITDGGHTWPGAVAKSGEGKTTQTISATQVQWAFFQAHGRRPE